MDVEDALRQIAAKAALLRSYGNACLAAAGRGEPPDPEAMSGLADNCDDIETLTGRVQDSLTASCLGVELRRAKT